MSVHIGSADSLSSYSAHHLPQQGAIVAATMSTFFRVLSILSLCYFLHRLRQNSRDSRVNNINSAAAGGGGGTATAVTTSSSCHRIKPEMLASLPVFVYPLMPQRENLECAICLTEFRESEKGRILPRCRHSFHTECIDMWLDSHLTCPLCRVSIEFESPHFAV